MRSLPKPCQQMMNNEVGGLLLPLAFCVAHGKPFTDHEDQRTFIYLSAQWKARRAAQDMLKFPQRLKEFLCAPPYSIQA